MTFSPRNRSDATQIALPAVLAHLARHGQQFRLLRAARQLDQHRQVDAGDHLDLVLRRGTSSPDSTACRRTCRSGSARPAPARRGRSPARSPRARRAVSSCQPIDTAANRGRSPTIVSAAFTSSVASWPWVTTTTPIMPTHAHESRCFTRSRTPLTLAPSDLLQRLGDHHRSVPAAGAADGHGQVALPFLHVLRQRERRETPSAGR